MNGIPTGLAQLVRRHPLVVVALPVLAACALAFGVTRLEFRTGQDTLLDPSSKISRDNVRFQGEFGGDPMLVLFEMPEGSAGDIRALFTPANREAMARLEQEMADSDRYESIITPLLILDFARVQIEQQMVSQPAKLARDEDAAASAARSVSAGRGETAQQQDAAAAAARQRVAAAFEAEFGADARRFLDVGERTLDNPRFVEFVLFGADGNIRDDLTGIFPDSHHALMVVRLKGNLSIDAGSQYAGEIAGQVASYEFEGVDARVSGPPLLIKEINDKMRGAMTLMAVLAVVIMMAVLFLVFRARWRLLSLPAVLIGCIAAFGLLGFAGIPLTMVTITGLPILIGLGVDFAIQMHSRMEEETARADSAEAGIEATFARLGPALAIAATAACIGFLVLHLSRVPMIRDFGSMLAVGSVIVFLSTTALLGGVLYLRERKRLGAATAVPRARFQVDRLVGNLTGRTIGRLLPIAVIAVIIALGGLYAGRRIPTETDPEKFVPSDSSVLTELHHVRDVSGSTSELNLLVETTGGRLVTDEAVLDWMGAFETREMERHPELRQSNSLASFTRSVTGEAPTTASAEAALASAPDALVNSVVSADRHMANITFALTGDDTLDDRKAITDAVEEDARPPAGVQVAPAGIAVVGVAAVDALTTNRDLMSLVAVAAVLGVLAITFRNPVKAIAPLLPVVLALGASPMLIYAMGMSYSPLTSISGPLIIAMGTEFSVLLMARYFEERAGGLEPRAAMSKASLRIGRAIMASGLTVMGGFGVLALSDFPLLDNFGKVTALNIGISLVSTLVLLPPLLVWADEERGLAGLPASVATD